MGFCPRFCFAPATSLGRRSLPFQERSVSDGYGETIDSTFYKVWSDGSWVEFYEDTTINGTIYTATLDAYGNEYFYDSLGYAGLQLYGYGPFIFDSPLPTLPDTVVGGLTYALQTTFHYQDSSYSIIDDETLLDTSTIGVPFGTFVACPGVESNTVITSGGVIYTESDVVYWLAKGPSDIAQDLLDFGYGIIMEYGVVNGQGWGVDSSMTHINGVPLSSLKGAAMPRSKMPSVRPTLDVCSLAPTILKGITPKLRLKRF